MHRDLVPCAADDETELPSIASRYQHEIVDWTPRRQDENVTDDVVVVASSLDSEVEQFLQTSLLQEWLILKLGLIELLHSAKKIGNRRMSTPWVTLSVLRPSSVLRVLKLHPFYRDAWMRPAL